MAHRSKHDLPLPALPESAESFTEDGKLGLELADWLTTMSQRAAAGDERASLLLPMDVEAYDAALEALAAQRAGQSSR